MTYHPLITDTLVGDLATAAAYMTGFQYIAWRHRKLLFRVFHPVTVLFMGAFVWSCGYTHALHAWNLKRGICGGEGTELLVTGAVSWAFILSALLLRPLEHGDPRT